MIKNAYTQQEVDVIEEDSRGCYCKPYKQKMFGGKEGNVTLVSVLCGFALNLQSLGGQRRGVRTTVGLAGSSIRHNAIYNEWPRIIKFWAIISRC